MFIGNDIVMFINKIINSQKDPEEIRENVVTFKDYLILTKMADEETIKKVELIIQCFDSIMLIKESMGYIDISQLLDNAVIKKPEKSKPKEYKKIPQPKVEEKHYHHYVEDYSSSCGSNISRYRC